MKEKPVTTKNDNLCFVTLKVARDISDNEFLQGLFTSQENCDDLIRLLIYFIDKKDLEVYGFVFLSDQIHMIVKSDRRDLNEVIREFKMTCAKEILLSIGRKLMEMDERDSRKHSDHRKLFNKFLNINESIFWESNDKFLDLNIDQAFSGHQPISSETLFIFLSNGDRNYLQLGADAFTQLMMQNMKL